MNALTFAVIGQDLRQCYLAEYLKSQGHQVLCHNLPRFTFSDKITITPSMEAAIQAATIVAGPVPFSKKKVPDIDHIISCITKGSVLTAGCLDAEVREKCCRQGVICYDYMESESLAWMNAALTAEGIILEIMNKTPFALLNQNVLIIGYGRCGKMTAERLAAMGCMVSICEAKEVGLAQACACGYRAFPPEELDQYLWDFSIVINTAPSKIITDQLLEKSRSNSKACNRISDADCLPILFDLASAPGGIDLDACKKHKLTAYSCLGLPGKIAPKTAGEAIGKAILRRKGIKL